MEHAALEAFNAFQKSRGLAQKELEVRDALQGIAMSQTNLINAGIFTYEEGRYEQAYGLFKAVIDAHEVLINDGELSIISAVVEKKDEPEILKKILTDYFDGIKTQDLEKLNSLSFQF